MAHSSKLYSLLRIASCFLLVLGLRLQAQAGDDEKILHTFTGGKDGAEPFGGLVSDSAGNLYGTTLTGGDLKYCQGVGCGVVFRLAPNGSGGWKTSVLFTFTGFSDGSEPYGVAIDRNQNLYGGAGGGGDLQDCYGGCGLVFELSPSPTGQWTETVLHNFTGGNDGNIPSSPIILDARGNLYGTTREGGNRAFCHNSGCGVVFVLSPASGGGWTESVLYRFTGQQDGEFPRGGLIFDAAGNLYGTTLVGGNLDGCSHQGCGVVFELTPNGVGWNEVVLFAFSGPDGGYPDGGLVFDLAGNLYGNSTDGGRRGCGATCGLVFELSPTATGSWTERIVHHFTGGNDGGAPMGALTRDRAGNLYGTTTSGGTAGWGVLFKLSRTSDDGWTQTIVHNFTDGADGGAPNGDLLLDSAGNLYGNAGVGGYQTSQPCLDGTLGCGVVFEFSP